MNEETKINSLINIGQGKLVGKLYDDLLSEPSKKAGQALSTIVNIGNTVLWPIKWFNERTKLYFENNLKKYEEELDKIPEEKIIEVPTEISNPILERFSYVSNEELSNAFVKLLATASSSDSAQNAHPGFIQIIDRISPDEAFILKYLASRDGIPVLNIKHYNVPENRAHYSYVIKHQTGIENKVKLNFPQNINTYLNNLESLGLIRERGFYLRQLEPEFQLINNKHKILVDNTFKSYNEDELKRAKIEEKGMYEKTNFGNMFIVACLSN